MLNSFTHLLILLLIIAFIYPAKPQIKNSRQIEYKSKTGIKYLLYLPPGYSKNDSVNFPLIFFLHGLGESGSNINNLKNEALPKFLETSDIPFIVVSPQCGWFRLWNINDLKILFDELIEKTKPDIARIYLTGTSMGGHATWELAMKYPHYFTAIAPVCGWGRTKEAYKIKNLPSWVFHGAKDKLVPLRNSERMVDALKKAGGNVSFTIYPKEGHKCWRVVYSHEKLYDWFLKFSKDK